MGGCCGRDRETQINDTEAALKKSGTAAADPEHAKVWANLFQAHADVFGKAMESQMAGGGGDAKLRFELELKKIQQNVAVLKEKIFDQHDKDHNRVLDKKEFTELLREWYQAEKAALPEIVHNLISSCVNALPAVIRNQVEAQVRAQIGELPNPSAEFDRLIANVETEAPKLFDKIDLDHDGKLSVEEFRQASFSPMESQLGSLVKR